MILTMNCELEVVRETWGARGRRVTDYTLYTGALGTAFLLLKSYQITANNDDLSLCLEIIKACSDTASHASGYVPSLLYFSAHKFYASLLLNLRDYVYAARINDALNTNAPADQLHSYLGRLVYSLLVQLLLSTVVMFSCLTII